LLLATPLEVLTWVSILNITHSDAFYSPSRHHYNQCEYSRYLLNQLMNLDKYLRNEICTQIPSLFQLKKWIQDVSAYEALTTQRNTSKSSTSTYFEKVFSTKKKNWGTESPNANAFLQKMTKIEVISTTLRENTMSQLKDVYFDEDSWIKIAKYVHESVLSIEISM